MVEGPKLIKCERLRAKLTPMACLVNRVKAMVLKEYPNIGPGILTTCLRCDIGRRVRAYLPGDQA